MAADTLRYRRTRLIRTNIREEAMDVTRRNLAVAGAVALGAASLLRGSAARADASDEAAVKDNVEALRKALLAADKGQLEQLTAAQLSYGHSSGKVQNKAEFIDGVMTRKAVVKSLSFPDLTVAVAGDAAVARHVYASESETAGKPRTIRLGVLAVWQKRTAAGSCWRARASSRTRSQSEVHRILVVKTCPRDHREAGPTAPAASLRPRCFRHNPALSLAASVRGRGAEGASRAEGAAANAIRVSPGCLATVPGCAGKLPGSRAE
jgi:hypothetical protein